MQDSLSQTAPTVSLRTIQPDDAPRLQAFMISLSDEARYFRFMNAISELPPALLRYFVEVDFDRDMALAAVIDARTPTEAIVGVGRYYGDLDGVSCEFALAVSDAWQHLGLGHRLMLALFESGLSHGYRHIHGEVLGENSAMLRLMVHLGFAVRTSAEDLAVKIVERALPTLATPQLRPVGTTNSCP
jgi:acetyltransferase